MRVRRAGARARACRRRSARGARRRAGSAAAGSTTGTGPGHSAGSRPSNWIRGQYQALIHVVMIK